MVRRPGFTNRNPSSGRAYRVGDYYRSNVDTDAVAQITHDDGTIPFIQLPVAYASPTWVPYSAKVYVPKDAVSVTLNHRIARVGLLQTDDNSLAQTTTLPFDRGLVSHTFDDTWQSIYDNALPVLERHHAKSTQYTLTGVIGTVDRMSLAMVEDLRARGHELGAHSVTHPDLTTVSPSALNDEVTASKTFLDALDSDTTVGFASPYRIYNRDVIGDVAPIYQSHRTTDVDSTTRKTTLMRID